MTYQAGRLASRRLAKAVRLARLERGWSQDDLAQRMGTYQSTVAKMENGGIKKIDQLYAVASALGTKPVDLLTGDIDGQQVF